jgi:lipopolysaccharide biosynthesis glycosyltransferase
MTLKRIVTAADKAYFYALMTLITTNFHRNDRNLQIEIWDLGLTPKQLQFLSLPMNQNIKLRNLSDLKRPPFRGAYDPKIESFAWKPLIIQESLKSTEALLWLDAGVAVCNDITSIFEDLNFNKMSFYENSDYLNIDFTSKKCLRVMNASEQELFAPQIHGNILGFQNSDNSIALVDDWCKFMERREVATSTFNDHRHDQSVLSILIAQRNIKILKPFGVINESADYQNAVNDGDLLLAHRRKFNWIDYNTLLNL